MLDHTAMRILIVGATETIGQAVAAELEHTHELLRASSSQAPLRVDISDPASIQERFVDEYLIDLNGTQAAVRAGYSAATANRIAAELLSQPDIQEELRKAKHPLSERTQIRQKRVLQELSALALS